jgi:hypothetical protein
MKLTAEQKQFIADMMAEFIAKNEEIAEFKPRRTLELPHTETKQFNYRMPIYFSSHIQQLTHETNSSMSFAMWHLMKFAFTEIRTPEYEEISKTQAFKSLSDAMRD